MPNKAILGGAVLVGLVAMAAALDLAGASAAPPLLPQRSSSTIEPQQSDPAYLDGGILPLPGEPPPDEDEPDPPIEPDAGLPPDEEPEPLPEPPDDEPLPDEDDPSEEPYVPGEGDDEPVEPMDAGAEEMPDASADRSEAGDADVDAAEVDAADLDAADGASDPGDAGDEEGEVDAEAIFGLPPYIGTWEIPSAPPPGLACGHNTCSVGEVCCNPSCGICSPLGSPCDDRACEPAITQPFSEVCGMATCNIGEICCDARCGACVGVGEDCPPPCD